jgi:hypothetical protein
LLQNTSEIGQVGLAEQIIDEYRAGRPLLIFAENLGDILDGMGITEQGKLRAWLYTHQRISIIATNQSISEDFDREDRPFYGFFTVSYSKPLSFKDSLNYLISLAKLDVRINVFTILVIFLDQPDVALLLVAPITSLRPTSSSYFHSDKSESFCCVE